MPIAYWSRCFRQFCHAVAGAGLLEAVAAVAAEPGSHDNACRDDAASLQVPKITYSTRKFDTIDSKNLLTYYYKDICHFI